MIRNLILGTALAALMIAGEAGAAGFTQTASIDTRLQGELATSAALRGGDQAVAQRLSTSFGVSTDLLLQEKAAMGAWTDVFLAHTLQANTRATATAEQILQMRLDGMSWTQITGDLRVSKGRFVDLVRIETRRFEASRGGVEGRVQTRVDFLDRAAIRSGDQVVAQRLATQFGVSASVLMQEKTAFNATWGDVFLAHTIQANSRTALTAGQLLQMRTTGMTWAQIGQTVRFPSRRLEQTVKVEIRNANEIFGNTGSSGRLQEQIDFMNAQATRLGDQRAAERLSARLGVSAGVLMQERAQFQASWSDIFLAHTIAQSARTTVTASSLLQMRTTGMTWTQIARGVRFSTGKLQTAFRTGTTETFDTELIAGGSSNSRVSGSASTGAKVKGNVSTRAHVGTKLSGNGAMSRASLKATRATMKATMKAMRVSTRATLKTQRQNMMMSIRAAGMAGCK